MHGISSNQGNKRKYSVRHRSRNEVSVMKKRLFPCSLHFCCWHRLRSSVGNRHRRQPVTAAVCRMTPNDWTEDASADTAESGADFLR